MKKKFEFEGFGLLLHPDLVNAINYSSGLGGCTQSCLSVLDSEQQGLSDDALKVVLDLIFRPAQPREVEKKNLKERSENSFLKFYRPRRPKYEA